MEFIAKWIVGHGLTGGPDVSPIYQASLTKRQWYGPVPLTKIFIAPSLNYGDGPTPLLAVGIRLKKTVGIQHLGTLHISIDLHCCSNVLAIVNRRGCPFPKCMFQSPVVAILLIL